MCVCECVGMVCGVWYAVYEIWSTGHGMCGVVCGCVYILCRVCAVLCEVGCVMFGMACAAYVVYVMVWYVLIGVMRVLWWVPYIVDGVRWSVCYVWNMRLCAGVCYMGYGVNAIRRGSGTWDEHIKPQRQHIISSVST